MIIFSKKSNILEDITTKWDICVNKIISYIKYDLKDDMDVKGENIKRWPLFIMLSAAIVCFGFSTSFQFIVKNYTLFYVDLIMLE